MIIVDKDFAQEQQQELQRIMAYLAYTDISISYIWYQ